MRRLVLAWAAFVLLLLGRIPEAWIAVALCGFALAAATVLAQSGNVLRRRVGGCLAAFGLVGLLLVPPDLSPIARASWVAPFATTLAVIALFAHQPAGLGWRGWLRSHAIFLCATLLLVALLLASPLLVRRSSMMFGGTVESQGAYGAALAAVPVLALLGLVAALQVFLQRNPEVVASPDPEDP